MPIFRLIRRLKKKTPPTALQLMVQKWREDGGDYRFRFDYDLDEHSLVIDLGGYEGQWASDLFSRYQCPIYIFEPVSLFARQISERFRKNDRIRVFAFGLGGSTRSETIHLSADGSSVFGQSGSTETIHIVDANDWISENLAPGQKIDLLKINIEGGEYELLERLIACRLTDRIENIQVQFHEISSESRHRMQAIQAALGLTHSLTYQYEFIWENWKRNAQSDSRVTAGTA